MKDYKYGQRIKTSLNTFVQFYEQRKSGNIKLKGNIIEERLKVEDTIYDLIKKDNLLNKSYQQIEDEFKGNERNTIILKTIYAINKFYRADSNELLLKFYKKIIYPYTKDSFLNPN